MRGFLFCVAIAAAAVVVAGYEASHVSACPAAAAIVAQPVYAAPVLQQQVFAQPVYAAPIVQPVQALPFVAQPAYAAPVLQQQVRQRSRSRVRVRAPIVQRQRTVTKQVIAAPVISY